MRLKRGGFAKTAPKSLENKILENARRVKEDFTVILPRATDEKAKKILERLEKKLERIWRHRDDLSKLESFSKKKGLESALAGLLILANNPRAPYLACVKIWNKEIAYAVRGKAEKEKLISLQYFDDPMLRILGFLDLAERKRLSLFSWKDKFICSSKYNIPDDFIDFLSEHLNLRKEHNSLNCDHMESGEQREHLVIGLRNLKINICRECIGDRNTLFEITRFAFVPDIKRILIIDIKSDLLNHGLKIEYKEDYITGIISDREFFEKNLRTWEEKFRNEGKRIIYMHGKVYDDIGKFLDDLNLSRIERRTLEIFLSKINEPVFLEDRNVNILLERFWKKYGEETLAEISNDPHLAKRIFSSGEHPIEQIKYLENISEKAKRISRYPSYRDLPPVARFVDGIVKEYIAHGKEKVLSLLSKPPEETRKRAIAYAFLLALGRGDEKRWQYNKEEVEFGEFLKDYVVRLLNSKPENYHANLKMLLSISGANEEI